MVTCSLNTLVYDAARCNGCGMCAEVCPHGVFSPPEPVGGRRVAKLVRAEACMECGACRLNCPTGAITVDSGVGCAQAMIHAALMRRREATCGPGCGEGPAPGRREAEC